jgi:hypothetical protein
LEEAKVASFMEGSNLMIAIHYVNPRILEAAANYAKGTGQQNIYVIYVDETPGLFVPLDLKPSDSARNTLREACLKLEKRGVHGIPVWRLAEDAGYSIADAAGELRVKTVFVGSSRRTFFWRMVRGRMLKRLAELLPDDSKLMVVG